MSPKGSETSLDLSCVPKYGLWRPGGTAAGLWVQICAQSPVLLGVYLTLSCFSSHLSLEILSPFLICSHRNLQAEVLQIMTVLMGPRLLTSPYLQVPVDEPVGLKVIIILPKRVDELFGHLHVESTQQGSRSCPPFSLQEEGPWG